MNENEIRSFFDDWNSALQTQDPKQVVALYAEDAILLPTLSNRVRHNHEEIEDYFVDFVAKHTNGTINESNIRIFGELATHSGIYTFSMKDGSNVPARFTFVYRNNGQDWKIIEHHSSQMPEPV